MMVLLLLKFGKSDYCRQSYVCFSLWKSKPINCNCDNQNWWLVETFYQLMIGRNWSLFTPLLVTYVNFDVLLDISIIKNKVLYSIYKMPSITLFQQLKKR